MTCRFFDEGDAEERIHPGAAGPDGNRQGVDRLRPTWESGDGRLTNHGPSQVFLQCNTDLCSAKRHQEKDRYREDI
jgi:hypothetical protein